MEFRIDPSKILNYLFSDRTPESASKNRFFRAIGFDPADWKALKSVLLRRPITSQLEDKDYSSAYATKHVYRCDMPAAPNDKTYCIRTVWQERGGAFWFVTAYPRTAS
jgi:hypothetical protein